MLFTLPACKYTQKGKGYIGSLNNTHSGRGCQHWDSQRPHKHRIYKPEEFPDGSVEGAANYCRNPDGEPGGPWCYTTDHIIRWEYCVVPFCATIGKRLYSQSNFVVLW